MRLEDLKNLSESELRDLLGERRSFVLYVRSEKDKEKIREIFDVDVVFPELAKTFGEKIPFFWCDIDEVGLLSGKLGVYFAPAVLLFREGKLVNKLEGIKSWAEYNSALGELLC
ncbi:thioredoxin family protein [Hydrogenivirga sp.]